MVKRFQKFQSMITKCLAPFMCYHASIHVGISSLLFLFQSFNEIMSFSFNHVYDQSLLREFCYKNSRIHL